MSDGAVAADIIPAVGFDRVEPDGFLVLAVNLFEPVDAGLCILVVPVDVAAAGQQFIRRHGSVTDEDDLVFASEVSQHPVSVHPIAVTAHGSSVQLFIYAVVKIEGLQVLQMSGLVQSLKQLVYKLSVSPHGTVGVDEKQQLDHVFAGLLVNKLKHAGIVSGGFDGLVYIMLCLCGINS